MKKSALFLAMAAVSAQSMGAAYKIPEQSVNSTALSGAYVANAHGPDASYYNPAAMVFNPGGASLEVDATFIKLSSIDFTGQDPLGTAYTDSTKAEHFLVPTIHYVSPAVGNARFGVSVVSPSGLSKRWEGMNGAFAQEFTLKTVEINPTAGYRFNDRLAIGGGLRILYSSGKVISNKFANPFVMPAGRDMEGDSWDFGYNLALHFKATDAIDLAATYRSKITMTEEGDATIDAIVGPGFPPPTAVLYKGDASVDLPLPAALNLAAAFDFNQGRTTIELVYERTFWSAYDELDFNYASTLPPPVQGFDDPIPKHWDDSNTFRLGITHQLDPKWTLMGGLAYDETPVPKAYLGYELPDSDAWLFSLGTRYRASDAFSVGAAILYDVKDEVSLTPGDSRLDPPSTVVGEFSNASAFLFTLGVEYRFQ
ncbi:MAG TPA: transporter [Sedimenticola thiotaurini]|uniref:Transporter n=1 Tax=Sedimenticola thiotaurini TaxID=1543721 RepID=A0A831W4X1_9GAMM|nr:transporter [Sedimenticola thiotaurini]